MTSSTHPVTLVFVPGLMCDHATFDPLRPYLQWQGPVAVADHGDADSLPAMAQALLEQHSGPLLLFGHSMGGRVALEAQRQQPQRCQALALMGTGCAARANGDAGTRETEHRQGLIHLAQTQGMAAMARQWLTGMLPAPRLHDHALTEAIERMFSRQTVARFQAQQQALLQRPDASAVLRQTQCPVLLLCGELDAWAPPAQHQAMQALAPHATLEVLAGVGHMCIMENPQAVAHALNPWLANAVN
ncbi:MAG: alpha/beta fold hydrolase [Burkholderiaceae bacterium]